MSRTRMPALFLGHGSPMNVLEDNRYTRAWAQLGETLPRPKKYPDPPEKFTGALADDED